MNLKSAVVIRVHSTIEMTSLKMFLWKPCVSGLLYRRDLQDFPQIMALRLVGTSTLPKTTVFTSKTCVARYEFNCSINLMN